MSNCIHMFTWMKYPTHAPIPLLLELIPVSKRGRWGQLGDHFCRIWAGFCSDYSTYDEIHIVHKVHYQQCKTMTCVFKARQSSCTKRFLKTQITYFKVSTTNAVVKLTGAERRLYDKNKIYVCILFLMANPHGNIAEKININYLPISCLALNMIGITMHGLLIG